VHPAAERRQDADAPVADLVAKALDDDREVGGDDAGRRPYSASTRCIAVSSASAVSFLAASPIFAPSSAGRPTPSPFQNGAIPGTPGAGDTSTRSRVISSMRHVDAPRTNVCPSRAS
jgi:hypothetical protein